MRVCGRTITNELNDLFSYIQLNSTTRARPDPTGPDRTGPDQTRVSDKVRGLCLVGAGRARLVEFSY